MAVVKSTKSAAVRTSLNKVRTGVFDMLHRLFLFLVLVGCILWSDLIEYKKQEKIF